MAGVTPTPADGDARSGRPQARSTPGELALRKDMPLVPISSIAGRALVTVIAIMTFLGSLTAGSALLISAASRDWRQSVAREMTIQVRPMPGRDIEAEVAKAAGIARGTAGVDAVTVFDKAEAERLLEPWLGTGLDLADLPIPRLIVVKLAGGHDFDIAGLRKTLGAGVAGVSLDDHHLWLQRLAAMADTVVGVAVVIFLLVLAAMGLAVGFATRGAMAGNQEIVGVLHFVGAEDRFIAGEFQRHFLHLGLRGGAIGGVCAMLVFLGAGLVEHWFETTPGADQVQALFGSFTLGITGYLAITAIAVGIAFVTGYMSRTIVYRHLQALE